VDPTAGAGQYYIGDMGGTSFASPIVAGAAALVVDVGYSRFGGGNAVDGRVVKAVLMNSATKTAGWYNGQVQIGEQVTTAQGLDMAVGAGALNLVQAYAQYIAGTTDVPGMGGGEVLRIGWDLGEVFSGVPNDYHLGVLPAGKWMTATLDWFVNRSFDDVSLLVDEVQFSNLDLQVWRMESGVPASLVATSASLYNNVEHLHFQLAEEGDYMLRVKWSGENFDVPGNTPDREVYALAWVVPEPGTLLLLLAAVATIAGRLALRRRQRGPIG